MTNPDLTPELLDELEEKARAATPGPWEKSRANGVSRPNGFLLAATCTGGWGGASVKQIEADAEYIAANYPGVTLSLISEVRRLRSITAHLPTPEDAEKFVGQALAAMEEVERLKKLVGRLEHWLSCPPTSNSDRHLVGKLIAEARKEQGDE